MMAYTAATPIKKDCPRFHHAPRTQNTPRIAREVGAGTSSPIQTPSKKDIAPPKEPTSCLSPRKPRSTLHPKGQPPLYMKAGGGERCKRWEQEDPPSIHQWPPSSSIHGRCTRRDGGGVELGCTQGGRWWTGFKQDLHSSASNQPRTAAPTKEKTRELLKDGGALLLAWTAGSLSPWMSTAVASRRRNGSKLGEDAAALLQVEEMARFHLQAKKEESCTVLHLQPRATNVMKKMIRTSICLNHCKTISKGRGLHITHGRLQQGNEETST